MATGAPHGRIAPAAAGGEDGSTSPGVPADALLGRPAFVVEAGPFTDYLAGTVVAVTGAAGSVGGALSKRLARLAVRELVLIDQSEAGLVDLARELEQDGAGARVTPVLADIRNRPRIASVLARHRPEVVFHAA
ncbi:MAG TPA: polysaccharide biosynthesis protein, partial [Gaiellaceae bacterium]